MPPTLEKEQSSCSRARDDGGREADGASDDSEERSLVRGIRNMSLDGMQSGRF